MEKLKANILFVDANMENREKFKSDFESYYNIHTAESTEKALEILKTNDISILIVDENAPELTGIKFFESILGEFPDVIRMLLSNSKDLKTLINAINEAHIFRYIATPWDTEEVKQSIDVGIKIHSLKKVNLSNINKMHEESLKMQRILSMIHKIVPGLDLNVDITQADTLFSGQAHHITALFLSINDINNLVATMEPPQLLKFLNDYFCAVSKCIVEHRGTIDKFIGGSILAIFGAPISTIDSEKDAVFCGLALLDLIEKFNETIREEGIDYQTKINIGINTGEAVTGNIGSQQYISYTAIGDTVNMASRISELAQQKPNSIYISQSVFDNVKDEFEINSLGKNEIRGKDKPIAIYNVVSR